ECDKPSELIWSFLLGRRLWEQFSSLLARISLGVFFAISGGNKLVVPSHTRQMYETLADAGKSCPSRIHKLCGNWGLIQPSTMSSPPVRFEIVMWIHQHPVLASLLPALHAFDARYSNVENRLASLPDRLWSRIRCGRSTRAEACRSVALRMDAIAARKEQS